MNDIASQYIYLYLIGQSDFINRQQFRGMFNLNYAPSITVSCVIFCKHYNTFDDETIRATLHTKPKAKAPANH